MDKWTVLVWTTELLDLANGFQLDVGWEAGYVSFHVLAPCVRSAEERAREKLMNDGHNHMLFSFQAQPGWSILPVAWDKGK
jgi:hypothetical protein